MRARSLLSGAALAVLIAGMIPAAATVLTVNSYDMPNGDGVASFGSYNYWDGNYSGAGPKGADGTLLTTPLTGGKGALTDGVISTTGFAGFTGSPPVKNSNASGTGLYVGWKYLDPVITFHLAPSTVYSIDMYVDYSYIGLVGAPATITIDKITYHPTVTLLSATDERLSVSFAGGVSGSTFTVQPNAGGYGPDAIAYNQTYPNFPITFGKEPWMMVSEVQFNGVTNAVPELSTWMMMLIGFAAIGYAVRRRQKIAIAA